MAVAEVTAASSRARTCRLQGVRLCRCSTRLLCAVRMKVASAAEEVVVVAVATVLLLAKRTPQHSCLPGTLCCARLIPSAVGVVAVAVVVEVVVVILVQGSDSLQRVAVHAGAGASGRHHIGRVHPPLAARESREGQPALELTEEAEGKARKEEEEEVAAVGWNSRGAGCCSREGGTACSKKSEELDQVDGRSRGCCLWCHSRRHPCLSGVVAGHARLGQVSETLNGALCTAPERCAVGCVLCAVPATLSCPLCDVPVAIFQYMRPSANQNT